MKKTLALVLAIVMALGCMSITAFAANNETPVKALITPADFGYTIVIPKETPVLTETNHSYVSLGDVSIVTSSHVSDWVEVDFTVDLTNANLKNKKNDCTIKADYSYRLDEMSQIRIHDQFHELEQQMHHNPGFEFEQMEQMMEEMEKQINGSVASDTKLAVYKDGYVQSYTISVTADQTQWNAAPFGEYNATLVFNFVLTLPQYNIVYKDMGNADFSGSFAETAPAVHTYGTATTLPEPTKENFVFGGWYTTPDCTGDKVTGVDIFAEFDGDITLYAKWNKTLEMLAAAANLPSSDQGPGYVSGKYCRAGGGSCYIYKGEFYLSNSDSYTAKASLSTIAELNSDGNWVVKVACTNMGYGIGTVTFVMDGETVTEITVSGYLKSCGDYLNGTYTKEN